MKEYIKWTTQQCRVHKLQSRLEKVARDKVQDEIQPMQVREMEKIDTQKSEIQLGGGTEMSQDKTSSTTI